MRRPLQARIAEHFELLLTIAGVLVAAVLTLAQLDLHHERLAFAFLVWLQGFILWALRRHTRLRRQALFERLRAMLQDRVNNQLTVMLAMADLAGRRLRQEDREAIERAMQAARTVSEELAHLSPESLESWESRYRVSHRDALARVLPE